MVASSCRQSDRDKTLFGYLSTGVKPSIAVIAPFHTSANANFSCMNIGFMFSSYFQMLCFLGEYLMKCLPCIVLQNRWQLNQNFEKIYIYIYFVPFLCSIFWFILESVQYHFKILASGQKSLWMSFVERLQIEQSWWEDYDLPDGTLCVLLFFLAVWPYWILRWETSLGFLCVLPICHLLYCTGCAASDGRHRIVELWFGIDGEKRTEKRLWNYSDTHFKEAIRWLHELFRLFKRLNLCVLLCFISV